MGDTVREQQMAPGAHGSLRKDRDDAALIQTFGDVRDEAQVFLDGREIGSLSRRRSERAMNCAASTVLPVVEQVGGDAQTQGRIVHAYLETVTTLGQAAALEMVPVAYRDLLGHTPWSVRRLSYSPSCVVLLAGSTRSYPDAVHHNIHFGKSWAGVFRELINEIGRASCRERV